MLMNYIVVYFLISFSHSDIVIFSYLIHVLVLPSKLHTLLGCCVGLSES